VSARPRLLRWLPLLGLGVVLLVALWVGTTDSSGHKSIDDRVQSVTSGLRCPVCTGETVADSAAPISQDIRTEVRQLLVQGDSDSQAKAFILSKYPGTSLSTPTSGLGLLVWALPVIAIASAVIGLVLMFSRWHARAGVTVSDEDRRLVDEARRGTA
jgi:cytochrome c-type biogenesis protein CcmH